MTTTSIEWTDATWNPVLGCSRVSKGCENCYAERVAHRGMSPQHKGLTVLGKKGPRWTGEVRFLPERLAEPLRWRKPRRVFVNSMSDLFHEGVSNEEIAAIFGVMAAAPQHTFQVLTKRPERARAWFGWLSGQRFVLSSRRDEARMCMEHAALGCDGPSPLWPLPNVWLGASVEDQAAADERILLLLETPAAVRWVSYEPALGPVDFEPWLYPGRIAPVKRGAFEIDFGAARDLPALSWIVVGGESGPGARPFDLAWARSTIAQCREAGVPVFVKQLGAAPVDVPRDAGGYRRTTVCGDPWPPQPLRLRDRKGGDPSEWPKDLRVREYPKEVSRVG